MALKVYKSMETNGYDFRQLSCTECARSGYKMKYFNYCTQCNKLFCEECISYHQDDLLYQNRGNEGSSKFSQGHGGRSKFCLADTERSEFSLGDDHRNQLLYMDFKGDPEDRTLQQSKQEQKAADTKRKLEDIQTELRKMIETETSAKQKRLETIHKTTEHRLDKLKAEVDDLLEDIKSSTLDTLNKVNEEIENHYGDKLTTLNRLQVKTSEALKKISEDENEQTHDVIDTVAKETQAALNIIEKDVNNYYSNIMDNMINAERQACVSVLTEAMDGLMCHLYALTSQLLEDDFDEISEQTTELPVTYTEHNIQADTDSLQCDITSCCTMEDGSIIITDWNNSNIKHLDENFDIINACSVPGLPWTVVAYDDNEVLVSLNLLQRIQWVTVERDQMVPTKSFKVNHPCKGLAYCWDKIYVSCGGDGILECQGQILVYDTNGNFLRTITQDTAGHKIVSNPQHLLVMQWQTSFKLFIADKELRLLAIEIRDEAHYKDSKYNVETIELDSYVTEAKGLCIGRNKQQMYLSDFRHGNIVEIESTGHSYKVTKLVTSNYNNHRSNSVSNSLCFIEKQQKLITTIGSNNKIRVYNI